jgi:8-oxo-dGTP diphosphatase
MPNQSKGGFFNPGVTVDVVVFTIENGLLKILLVKRSDDPFKGFPALPGGFIRRGETTHEAAERVLKDKAGIENVYVEQLYTFDEVRRDPRGQVLSVSYFALVPSEDLSIRLGRKTEHPEMVAADGLPALAFDHNRIVVYSRKRLADKIRYSNVAYSLLPSEFTLTELQKIYETVLGRRIDKRNFRKKYLELGLIKSAGKKRKGLRQRPALLYRFVNSRMEEMDRFLKQ